MTAKIYDGKNTPRLTGQGWPELNALGDVFRGALPEAPVMADLVVLASLDLFRGAAKTLKYLLDRDKVSGITWKNPYAQLEFEVDPPPAGKSAEAEKLTKEKLLGMRDDYTTLTPEWVWKMTGGLASPDFREMVKPAVLQALTQGVRIILEDGVEYGRAVSTRVILPPDLEAEVAALPEDHREKRTMELADGRELRTNTIRGTVDTPAGKQDFALVVVFAIRPLHYDPKRDRAFYPLQIGLDFTEGDLSVWPDDEKKAMWDGIFGALDVLSAPFLDRLKAEGLHREAVPKPDRVIPIRREYFKMPGRLFDTPRQAIAQRDIPAIAKWYQQTAFNLVVLKAAAALTKAKTREDALGIQSATVEEIEDLVYCISEEGAARHWQHREDILRAFEAARAIPVPIVKVNWKSIASKTGTRWVKDYKLGVGQMFQSYFPVFRDRVTGKIAHVNDPARSKELVKRTRKERRKLSREIAKAPPDEAFLLSFPPDKYELASMEWRWNTDIAEDYICPQVALTEDNRPRRKLQAKGFHHEGSRFVMLHRRYFAIHKQLREAGLTYATLLLDLIVSEKTNIKSRSKGAVCMEIEAGRVIKQLGLWEEYEDESRRKHVLEDHIAPAIWQLIQKKVMLPDSWLVPQTDPNPDRRVNPFYRWKVAELWTTIALVSREEAKEIKDEQAGKTGQEDAQAPADALAPADQAALPGLEAPAATPTPAMPIPAGADIRAAREAAGMNLRSFAKLIAGPSFATWSLYETGKAIRVGKIKPEAWQRVRDFIAQHGPKQG